jgi:hypothetical protein
LMILFWEKKDCFWKFEALYLEFASNCSTFAKMLRMKKLLAYLFMAFLAVAPLAAEKVVVPVVQDAGVVVVLNGKIMQLQNANVGDKLEILNIVGVKIFEKKIESSNPQYTLDLPKGYYIVKVGDTVRKISVK